MEPVVAAGPEICMTPAHSAVTRDVSGEIAPPSGRGCVVEDVRGGGTVKEESTAWPESSACVLSSGHGLFQMLQFASSLVSPMLCGTVMQFGKDIYILTLGANVGLMGVAGTVLAVWVPCCGPLVGYVLDKNLLVGLFPWERWGRRAPWFMTHIVGAAFCTAAVFVPPSFDSQFLCVWFLIVGFANTWFITVLFNCIEAARLEIYPTKEERSECEALVKVLVGVGTGMGILTQLVILDVGTNVAVNAAGGVILVLALTSLVAVPVLRSARQVYDRSSVGSPWAELRGVFSIAAFWHFVAYRFSEGLLNSLFISNMLYYLTFVERQVDRKRSATIVGAGFVISVLNAALLLPWTQFFRVRRRGVNVNVVCASVMFAGVLAPVVLAVLKALTPSPVSLVGFVCVVQCTITGQTFWRAAALGWLVDEDCQAKVGRRRESLLYGCSSFFNSIGRALGIGLILIPLAVAGLSVEHCETVCDAETDKAAREACVGACDRRNIDEQPQSVRDYVNAVYYGLTPFLQFITAMLVYTFPIYGARLDAIYLGQVGIYQPAAKLEKSPTKAQSAATKEREAVAATTEDSVSTVSL